MRYLLFQRDKGICALCKTNTVALKAGFEQLARKDLEDRRQFLRRHGIPYGRASSDWWDADHIKPVVEGGGECGLDNLRTLCIPCHQKAPKELAGRLADARAAERAEADLKAISEALQVRPVFGDPKAIAARDLLREKAGRA